MEEAFLAIERHCQPIRNQVEDYWESREPGDTIMLGHCEFERVNSFKYLGLLIIFDNISAEVKARIQTANKCYAGFRKLIRSNLCTRATKILSCKILIRPVMMYGSATWAISKAN